MSQRATLPASPPGRATIYVRLSRQASESNMSKTGMLADCRDLAQRMGLSIVGEHVDDGISGAVRKRPALLRWLADVEEGRAGVMISWHADRLTREGINAAALILDVVEGKDRDGVTVRQPARLLTVDGLDSVDEEAFRWRFVIAAEVARSERNRMKARQQAARRRAKEQGRWVAGAAPFGHALAPREGGGKVLVEHPEEAALLREVADRLMRGASVLSSTRWLNDQPGSKPRRTERWSPTALHDSLLSSAKRGLIFTPSQARALLDLLDKPKGAPRPVKAPVWLLSRGLAKCDSCGSSLTSNSRSGKPFLRCPSGTDASPCPQRVTIRADWADRAIEADYLAQFGWMAHYEERVMLTTDHDLDAAEAEWSTAQAALAEHLTPEALERAQVAKAAVEEARAETPTRRTSLVPTGLTVVEAWAATDVEERQRWLSSALVGPVRVLPPSRRGRVREEQREAWVKSRLSYTWRADSPESEYEAAMADISR